MITRSQATLASPIADQIFGTVAQPIDCDFGANHDDCDYSLCALIRYLELRKCGWKADNLPAFQPYMQSVVYHENDLSRYFTTSNKSVITLLKYSGKDISKQLATFPEYTRMNSSPFPIEKFLSQIMETVVWQSVSKQQVVVLTNHTLNEKWYNALLGLMPRICPWFYDAELPEEEAAVYKAIAAGNYEPLKNYLNNIDSDQDLRSLAFHKMFDGYQDRNRDKHIKDLENVIKSLLDKINRLTTSLDEYYRDLQTAEDEEQAFSLMAPNSSSEVYDFFYSHKMIDIQSVCGDNIMYTVTDSLEYYDEETFKQNFNNKNSYFYRGGVTDKTRQIMKAIFADNLGTFRVSAQFNLSSLRYVQPSGRTMTIPADTMPHPHLYFHSCLGQNKQYLTKFAEKGEWQLAIEQTIGAVKNLNFGDSVVLSSMMTWLQNNMHIKCIIMQDTGELVSPNEFYERIYG